MRIRRARKPKLPPKVPYRFIAADSEVGRPMYALLVELLEAHHTDVAGARFALAWHLGWKRDVDGRVTLGMCHKVSNLDRELHASAFDFVIILRREYWTDPLVTELQRRALLDHELCHAAVKVDDHGDPLRDECGRVVYRIRRHDLEEFGEIAGRYGCWKRDLETFAKQLDRARTPEYVGYIRLQQALRAVGVELEIDAIIVWSEAERTEALAWSTLARQAGPDGLRPAIPEPVKIATSRLELTTP